MTNFLRASRLAWRYRTAYFLSLVFALAGAAVFSGSLGAIFPVIKGLFDKKTLQEWIAEKVADQENAVTELDKRADPKKPFDGRGQGGTLALAHRACPRRPAERYEEGDWERLNACRAFRGVCRPASG